MPREIGQRPKKSREIFRQPKKLREIDRRPKKIQEIFQQPKKLHQIDRQPMKLREIFRRPKKIQEIARVSTWSRGIDRPRSTYRGPNDHRVTAPSSPLETPPEPEIALMTTRTASDELRWRATRQR